jgi:hypothetical protein
MQHLTMVFGLARTFLGGDYRSRSQRQQLRRLGREFLDEGFGDPATKRSRRADAGLEDHPNALIRQ